MAGFDPLEFFQKTTHFASQGRSMFTIMRPNGLTGVTDPTLQMGLSLLERGLTAKTSMLPGVRIATFDPYGYNGPTRRHGYGLSFEDLSVEYLLMGRTQEEARSIYMALSAWFNMIGGTAETGLPRSDSTFFSTAYYDDYVSTGEIRVFSPTSEDTFTPVMQVGFSEIWPHQISPILSSWENPDTPMSLTVGFSYFYARPIGETGSPGSVGSGLPRSFSTAGGGASGGGSGVGGGAFSVGSGGRSGGAGATGRW